MLAAHMKSVIALMLLGCAPTMARPPDVWVAKGGKARMPVVVAPDASARVCAAATELATHLGRITGATFAVTNGNGLAGIAVGMPANFPEIPVTPPFDSGDLPQKDDYLLQSHTQPAGVYVLGATEQAVERAVWDFLHRLGYRYYFPNAAWEIVPSRRKLSVDFNVHESPDYLIRDVSANYRWPGDRAYEEWQQRNRLGRTLDIWHIHSWHAVVSENQKAFDANPDFYPLVDGARQTNASKFCSANLGVRELCFQYTTNYFARYPCDGVSLDPTDGSWHYCEDDLCRQVGTRTDQVVDLANWCAKQVRALGETDHRFQNKYIGINAYNVYCAPPAIAIDSRVSVQVANGLMGDGNPWTIAELLDGWSKKTAGLLGIYDYYSLIVWGANKPANMLASNTGYIGDSIPAAYRKYGVRTFTSEGSIDFGPCGLGYYLASRLLWDTTESPEAIKAEFFTNCFGTGPCRDTMIKFYELIDVGNRSWAYLDNVDLIGRMYRLLQIALSQTTNPQIRERIHQVVLYTRYAELERNWETAPTAENVRSMMSFAYRIKDTHMVHSAGLWYGLGLTVDESWKTTDAFTDADYAKYLADGIANNPVQPFTPVKYSADLVPATPLNLPPVTNGFFRSIMAEPQLAYTWVTSGQTSITVRVTNGERPQKLYLYSGGSSQFSLEDHREVMHPRAWQDEPVAPADAVTLPTTHTGLHRLQRAGNYHNLSWDAGTPMTFPTGTLSLNYGDHLAMYFYVPRGTTALAFRATCPCGIIKDSSGTKQYDVTGTNQKLVSIPVPAGQDGALWKLEEFAGIIHFFTVPPYLARIGAELLLPREVVEADRRPRP